MIILPKDIITYIISFLENKDTRKLINTCNFFYKHGKKYGYLTYLKATSNTDMLYFYNLFLEHYNCVTTIEINGIKNPQLLLPKFVQNINFNHCYISKYLDPGKQIYQTKKIRIRDYNRYKNKQTLRVNWSRFPNLKELDLYVYNVDLTGIKVLKKLKNIRINTVIK